jgi:hypothetical protein
MSLNKKISELDPASTLAGSEDVEILQVGVNKRATLNVIKTFFNTLDWSAKTLTVDQHSIIQTWLYLYGASKVGVLRNTVKDGTILISGGDSTDDGANIQIGGSLGNNDLRIRIGSLQVAKITSNGKLELNTTPATGASTDPLIVRASTGEVNQIEHYEHIQIACSDLSSDLTIGTSKAYFRMSFAMTLTAVRASVLTAPTGSTLIVDINEAGSTILSTKLSIDATEKTSTTAASAAVISDTALADDAEITIDIDQVGSTIAGTGLIVTLIGYRA